MAAQLSQGDVEAPTVEVQPFDDTTAATLTVTAPDGTQTTPPVSHQDNTPQQGTQTWVGDPVTYDQAGRWVHHWVITGLGGRVVNQELYVLASPVAGGPTWTPGRSRVANYVPLRTLERDTETHDWTFTANTFPPGITVDRLIADAVSTIQARAGEVHAALFDAASVVAAKLAACAVERGFPAQQTEQSLTRARDICQDAAKSLDDLVVANRKPDDPGNANALLPLYSFPKPVKWGDENFI